MKIKPFRIEEYFAKYEFTAKYLLSSSDAESRTVSEVLDLEPGAHERMLEQWCGYTEAAGAPYLREAISQIYTSMHADDVVALSAAEEGIFVLYHALVGEGDHVIVETPCFESGLEVARSTGAEVSTWQRHGENGWQHDVEALAKLIRPNTKIIYINTPHNPTGLLMPREVFDEVMRLARKHGCVVFCDEVYRELEHDPATRLQAACDVYERAVSLGSMSKTYGLAGLRLGWLATRDADILQLCVNFKNYTTICNSAPSEFLCATALRHREVLVQRNRDLVISNLAILDEFFAERADLFTWTHPNASPIGFARFRPENDVLEFCERVVRETSVMLLPGNVYDQPGYIRFGFGRKNMPEALARFAAHLKSRY